MECPLKQETIEDAVYLKGHFYERGEIEKLFHASDGHPKDPYSRERVDIKDVTDGTWFNSLRTNIQHLMPTIGPDGEGGGVIIDILNEYVECALTEEDKAERKEEVKKIKLEWGI
jgi:hypothetical protein